MSEAVVLRPAVLEDAGLLLEWANDPITRAGSRRHAPIRAAVHRRWLERRLSTPNENRIWIGERGGIPMGVVRFERRGQKAFEVSITVAPGARGRGLGRPLLEAGIAAAREAFGPITILADILGDNDASVRLFTSAGFTPIIPTEEVGPSGIISVELR